MFPRRTMRSEEKRVITNELEVGNQQIIHLRGNERKNLENAARTNLFLLSCMKYDILWFHKNNLPCMS